MYLDISSESFTPKNFLIVDFYGKNVCFVWEGSDFVCFPYTYENSTEKLKVFKAPADIKAIRGFNKRVFMICYPNGIHKLTENFEFAALSKSGIELGSDFCEVLIPNSGVLVLENKKLKSLRSLFSLSSTSNVHVLSLNFDKTDKILRKALLSDSYTDNVHLCIIAHDKNLFKMSNQIAQIIYTCDYIIKSIEPVMKQEKIVGAVLQVDGNLIILMHIVEDKLKYEKVFLRSSVDKLCVTMDLSLDDTLLFVHSDGQKTYYTKKSFGRNSGQETKIEEKFYESFRFHGSKFIIYLKNQELIQIPIDLLTTAYNQCHNEYIKLEPGMLKGLERIIGDICDKSMELQKLRKEVVDRENVLQRINLFVTKQHIKYCPKESVERIANQTFLLSNFKKVLPENSIVVKMLKSKERSIFSMKHIKNCDTVVEMPVSVPNLSSKLYTTTDLITYKNDGKIWCLIKNYIKDPPPSKNNRIKLSQENENFIKYKLVVLQNLIEDNKLTMETLSALKREVRQELSFNCEIFN